MLMAEPPTRITLGPNLTTQDQRLAILAAGERRELFTYLAMVDGRYLIARNRADQQPVHETLDGAQVDRIPFDFFVEPITCQEEST